MTLIYGHRGARGEAPENTLMGFQTCLTQGITRCELDLHLSRDGQLMVIHDPDLKRTTRRKGKVSEHTTADLITYDARFALPHWPQRCPIPTLAELFEQCPFEHWQLELKSTSKERAKQSVQAVQDLVRHYGLTAHVTITSSDRTVLAALCAEAPQLSRGFIAERAWLNPIKVALRYQCHFLVLHEALCTPVRIKQAHQHGLHLSAWTVNDTQRIRSLAQLGVDSIISDYPSRAITALNFHQ